MPMSEPKPPLSDPAPRQCPALFLTASASGQGKTTLVAGLARHHHRLGRRVRVFKTGPDFLDPMILSRASAATVGPLDLWMVGASDCRRKLWEAAGEADLILVEGAMGLFDGMPSGADLAETFGIPVAALIDARGMGQTFGALALGLATYRPALSFAGILANRVASPRHEAMIRGGLPPGLRYLGSMPRLAEAELPSRHLGLVQASEIVDLEARLDLIADRIGDTALAELPAPVRFAPPAEWPILSRPLAGRRIAIARDAAFSFLYEDNLRLLEALGADLSFFSPLADPDVRADAIYLPGGYPELHLHALAANAGIKDALARHLAAGRPLYAECGGMLYLLDRLTDKAGHTAEMAGLLPGQGQMRQRLAGLGMQSLDLPPGCLRGHSFHHSTMETPVEPVASGQRQSDGRAGEPFYRHGTLRASYLHLYFPSAPAAAAALFLPDREMLAQAPETTRAPAGESNSSAR
ncbi:cobyrinate a,c-diamide synthase [Thiocystis violascens]|uniref:Cobyrinic acid a,c-diamide synthase n=1 Tax=Thiocystis violascens (strain ATCC 17096 / DSM 198 / 6111) TaxID=765911 RepID=I3Y9K3_THIV6|nr:cobyrinic acid a,c-diamide synthase [Thiocystis violascens DSM 198]